MIGFVDSLQRRVKQLTSMFVMMFCFTPELLWVFNKIPVPVQSSEQILTVLLMLTSIYWTIHTNAYITLFIKVIINMVIYFCTNWDEQSYQQFLCIGLMNVCSILYRLVIPMRFGTYVNYADISYGRTIPISQKMSIIFDLFLENVVEPLIDACLLIKQWVDIIKSKTTYFGRFSDAAKNCRVKNDYEIIVISSDTYPSTTSKASYSLSYEEAEIEERSSTNLDKMFISIIDDKLVGRSFTFVSSHNDSDVPKPIRRTYFKRKYRMKNFINPLETIPENAVLGRIVISESN